MMVTFIRLAWCCLAGGILGLLVGGGLSIAFGGGPCPVLEPGIQWAGAGIGAGIAAVAVLSERPDPAACNRQDPPFPPHD